jgi:uncharacterized membrane protein YbhN (UPF0104 family)
LKIPLSIKTERLRLLLVVVLLLLSLAGISFYLLNNRQLLELLANLSWPTAIILVILRLLFIGLNGLFLKLFAARLNVYLAWYEWSGLPFVTSMGNYLTPLSGGMLARAAYLKNRHSFSYTHFTTVLAANYLIIYWVAALTGLIASPLLLSQAAGGWLLVIFFALTWIGISVILLMPLPQITLENRLGRLLSQAVTGWQIVRQDKRLIGQLVVVTVVSMLLNAASFWVAYQALNVPVSPAAVLIISLSTVFAVPVTLTPGNFGIQEAFVSLTSEVVGHGVGTGLLVALLIRAGTLVSAFTLGPLFSVLLAREVRFSPPKILE